jgi:Ca2+-binding EF-hand superfamily protein
MFKGQLSAETAFEQLLTKAGKLIQKRLNRVDFHTALAEVELRFSAPEVDGLFKTLDTNQDGELDLDEWLSRIYCDSQNPL